MPSLPFYYNSFSGGLNTKDSPDLLQDEQARDLQNVQGTTAGAIVKRAGLTTEATLPATPVSLFTSDSTVGGPVMIASASSALYDIVGGSPGVIKTGLTSGARWEWVSSAVTSAGAVGPFYGMNGFDTPQQWTGSGTTSDWVATTGTVPKGRYMVLAGNRIWVAGVGTAPDRVFFSDLIPDNDGTITWPSQNVAVFDENDGLPITGLGHVGPYVLVAKARKLFVITDMNTGDARRLSDNIGCVSHRSIAEAPEGTYFLAPERGVYLTDGSKITPVADVIKPLFERIAMVDLARAAGVYYDGHYYLSLDRGSTGTNNATLDFDSVLQSWWLHTFESNQFSILDGNLYSAKASAAIIDQCFDPSAMTDNGTPFLWRWRGPWQSPTFYRRRRFPTPYFRKRLRQVRVEGLGTVDCSVATDLDPSTEALKQADVFNAATVPQLAKMFSFGVQRAWSLTFSGTSTTSDMVFAYVLEITDRKDGIVS